PGASLHVFSGGAVRVDRTRAPDTLPGNRREGRGRAVEPGRRDVGRAGHELAERREHRPPTRVRPALLRVEIRRAQFGGVDPRRVRLPGHAAPGLPAGRLLAIRHPEAELEQAERLPALDVLVARDRRLEGTD